MSLRLPVSRISAVDALFSQLCRATPDEALAFAALLTARERAALALACNARTHLRDQARAIAGACGLDALIAEGGQAGRVLFEQAGGGGDTWGTAPQPEKRRVSLAG